jgi:hypothetical protein
MIKVLVRGSTKNVDVFFNRMIRREQFAQLEKFGQIGVNALAAATPEETGETANSWYYEIFQRPGYYSIRWANSHMEEGISIAAILQYGHATGSGAYIQGVDYINPAMLPIFEEIAADMWKEVTR